MSTRSVVDRYYELVNVGDWATWLDLFAEDQIMDEQLGGHLEGIAALKELAAGFPGTFSSFANKPVHIVVDGEQAAVVSHITAVTQGADPVEVDVANYFRVVEDKIAYLSNYHDTAPFAALST